MVATSSGETIKAVFAIIVSVFALSLGDAVIKATSLSLPLWQMYILRSALTLPPLLLIAIKRGRGAHALRVSGWSVLRSFLLVVMWLSYYVSLPLVPLSLAAAVYYTSPIFILMITAILAHRLPSVRACLAIACGFLGVVLVIRPDATGFDFATLLPVLSAFLYACAMVLTSAKCRDDDPFVLAIVLNVTFIVFGAGLGLFSGEEGAFLLGPWQTIDLSLITTVAVLAALILIGSVGAAIAYQRGAPATVAAFDYSYLLFSTVWGVAWFGEWPGLFTYLGFVLIIGAGFLAITRQKANVAALVK
ncbi:DMT family transporter [Thalassospira sp.]|uniref:DMT family transporter n=1 Tax=Thalassospira sp. TaxID=1912094 RepID=UPI003AA89811